MESEETSDRTAKAGIGKEMKRGYVTLLHRYGWNRIRLWYLSFCKCQTDSLTETSIEYRCSCEPGSSFAGNLFMLSHESEVRTQQNTTKTHFSFWTNGRICDNVGPKRSEQARKTRHMQESKHSGWAIWRAGSIKHTMKLKCWKLKGKSLMDPTRWHWADRLPFRFRIWEFPLLSISFDGAFQLNDFVLSDWDSLKPWGSSPTLATIAWSLQEKELLASKEFPAGNASLTGLNSWILISNDWPLLIADHIRSGHLFYTGYRVTILPCSAAMSHELRQVWSPLPGESWSILLAWLIDQDDQPPDLWLTLDQLQSRLHGRLAKPLSSLGLADVFGRRLSLNSKWKRVILPFDNCNLQLGRWDHQIVSPQITRNWHCRYAFESQFCFVISSK